MNIYTVLLIIALVSLLTACALLYLELDTYGGPFAIKGRVSMLGGALQDISPSLGVFKGSLGV